MIDAVYFAVVLDFGIHVGGECNNAWSLFGIDVFVVRYDQFGGLHAIHHWHIKIHYDDVKV